MRIFILFIFLTFPSHAVVKEQHIKFTLLTDAEQQEYRSKKIKIQHESSASELVEEKQRFLNGV